MKVEIKELPPPPCEYVITLTREEAEHLSSILGCLNHIDKHGMYIPAALTSDKLWCAFRELGVSKNVFETVHLVRKDTK